MAGSASSGKTWSFGLLPPRDKVPHHARVTLVLKVDLVFRVIACLYLHAWHWPGKRPCWTPYRTPCQSELFTAPPMAALLAEQFAMCCVLAALGRWEDQGHFVTLWQAFGALETFAVRRSLYAQPLLFVAALVLLWAHFFVGVHAELSQRCEARIPPFPPKSADQTKPRHGWLGKRLAQTFKKRILRILVTFFLYLSNFTFPIIVVYGCFFAPMDDLRGLDRPLEPLLWVAVFGALLSVLPSLVVALASSVPGLFWDCMRMQASSRGYQTDVMDVAEIDDDLAEAGEMRTLLKTYRALSLTIVIPCYMPNEEETLPDVLDFYEAQLSQYPGESKVLIVWNSPRNHPEFEELMEERKKRWPTAGGLVIKRNHWSSCKCDNLNMACDFIDTDMACINKADTMLHWGTMVRASVWIGDRGYDIAQSMSVHSKADCMGKPSDGEDASCHLFGALMAANDGTKHQNLSTQNMRSHSPFNGRGGFWRSSALKLVGFDHHTMGEDHDAAYRGFSYYGFKGVLDGNMLCQEQEPQDFANLKHQRIRWETAALEMRRTFIWILLSKNYSRLEKFTLLWSQLELNCNMPLQALPMQVASGLPLVIIKGYLTNFVFHSASDDPYAQCEQQRCVVWFRWTVPVVEHQTIIILDASLIALLAVFSAYVLVSLVDFCLRVLTTRYRPRAAFVCYHACLKTCCVAPLFLYLQYWALYDYLWGSARFLATARSPPSHKTQAFQSPGIGSRGLETGDARFDENVDVVASRVDPASLSAPLLAGPAPLGRRSSVRSSSKN